MTTTPRPFFSIIIPVYQSENTLSNCIESVLDQDEDDFEVILADDGSTDKSKEICDFYANKFPNKFWVLHKLNEGPLIARIEAICMAKGQYLMFLDSDDLYLPGILNRVKEAVKIHQADMVIFNYFRVFPDGTTQLYMPQYPDGKVFEESGLVQLYVDAITGENLNALWQKCIRRELLANVKKFRQNGRMLIGEDKLLSLEMIGKASKVVYLADGLYGYHIIQQSISHSLSLRHYQDMSKVYLQTLKYMSYWKLGDYRSACCRNKVEFGLSCLYSIAGKVLLRQKDISEFVALAHYIIIDQEYWNAFHSCKKMLDLHKRVACWLLQHNLIYLELTYLCVSIIIKRKNNFRNFV